MENDKFKKIVTILDTLILEVEKITKRFKDTDDIYKNCSLQEFKQLTVNAVKIQGKLDKVLQVELYHIIGMGDLNVKQEHIFISKVKRLSENRSKVKYFACLSGLAKSIELGTYPPTAEYKCGVLGVELKVEL